MMPFAQTKMADCGRVKVRARRSPPSPSSHRRELQNRHREPRPRRGDPDGADAWIASSSFGRLAMTGAMTVRLLG